MARKKINSCYAVREGRRPGIYRTWRACKEQVTGYSGAEFKGFVSHQEAVDWLNGVDSSTDDSDLSDTPSSPLSSPPPATFDSPVHHGAASSALDVRGTFYAVARGRQPGIYYDWEDCRAQVNAFSGARYKKFGTLAGAQEFCAVYGGGGHFSLFKSEDFEPDQKASFSDEWARLSQAQGWEPGTQHYREQRASALRNEIRTHFFASENGQLPVVKEEGHDGAPASIKKEEQDSESLADFDHQHHEAAHDLLGFQSMCRAVGKTPGDTISQCEMILKSTLVNIVDLINARRTGRDTALLPWTNFAKFKAYTLGSFDKTMPINEAKRDPILRCFLQNFSAPRDSYVTGPPPRGQGSSGRLGHRPLYSGRRPVASPQQQPPSQQHNPSPIHNTHPAVTPPSAGPQDEGVAVKKRAMSEEDNDFKDHAHQEKKVKVEDAIKADEVIVVKEVKVKVERVDPFKNCEKKKIEQRWTPSNSIMRNWISSV